MTHWGNPFPRTSISISLVYVKALAECDLFYTHPPTPPPKPHTHTHFSHFMCAPWQRRPITTDISSMQNAPWCIYVTLTHHLWYKPLHHSAMFRSEQMCSEERFHLLQRATWEAEDTQFADKRTVVMLSAKACRSSSATCSVCSFPCFNMSLCFRHGWLFHLYFKKKKKLYFINLFSATKAKCYHLCFIKKKKCNFAKHPEMSSVKFYLAGLVAVAKFYTAMQQQQQAAYCI